MYEIQYLARKHTIPQLLRKFVVQFKAMLMMIHQHKHNPSSNVSECIMSLRASSTQGKLFTLISLAPPTLWFPYFDALAHFDHSQMVILPLEKQEQFPNDLSKVS